MVIDMKLDTVKSQLRSCGVVGAGGAGFPSYAKLDARADTIILNCAECEPLLTLHRQVLAQYADEILCALDLLADAVGASEIAVAVKASYTEAVRALQERLSAHTRARIAILPEVYPAGDEVVTIYEATGRVVRPGSLPISEGVIVYNVETMKNAYDALTHNKPVTHKYVTITGAVNRACTLLLPLGMRLSDAVAMAGGESVADAVYINGGPMTGNIVARSSVVTKTTNAVIVLPPSHPLLLQKQTSFSVDLHRAMSVCCQCQMCTDLCPRNQLGHPIEPHAFMRALAAGAYHADGEERRVETAPLLNAMFCCSCGVCEHYACMQSLSPRTLIAAYKAELRKNGVKVPTDAPLQPVSAMRQWRQVPKERLTARLGLEEYAAAAPIVDAVPVVKTLTVLLSQHIGAPAVPVVAAGDSVVAGQCIARAAEGALGVDIHAPVSGTVTAVSDRDICIEADRKEANV